MTHSLWASSPCDIGGGAGGGDDTVSEGAKREVLAVVGPDQTEAQYGGPPAGRGPKELPAPPGQRRSRFYAVFLEFSGRSCWGKSQMYMALPPWPREVLRPASLRIWESWGPGEGFSGGVANCGAPGSFCGIGERRAWAWVRLIGVAILALGVPAVHPREWRVVVLSH